MGHKAGRPGNASGDHGNFGFSAISSDISIKFPCLNAACLKQPAVKSFTRNLACRRVWKKEAIFDLTAESLFFKKISE
jgi:hypothetical protein